MGINISEADARQRLAGFIKRTGWDSLPAVAEQPRLWPLPHRLALDYRPGGGTVHGEGAVSAGVRRC